jgi:AraC family transcriptional regulator of adaptative response / methylphosphotriester-DNA alkyltransferase methyltransferase
VDNEERWNAVVKSNGRYDGLFYYAVKTTRIFCRPSCKAKAPLKKNTLFFDDIQDALREGFRPCKMCRPDLNSPVFDPNKELIKKVKQEIENSYSEAFSVYDTAQKLGLSGRHLVRLFKEYYGMTPNEYIQHLKINKSRSLLMHTNKDIIDIAYGVGFKSLSTFYKSFKVQVGTTPGQYRKNR